MLDERGLACKGCSEKDEYIKLVNDNQVYYPGVCSDTHTYHLFKLIQHLPVKEKVVVEETKEKKPVDQAKLDKEMEDLQGMLKGFGGGGAKIFTAKDFEGLSPEELADKFSGSSKSKKSNKSSKKAKKPAEPKKSKFAFPKHSDSDSEENIEL